jgi:membrane fusion protein, copper/silver efflux system
MKRNSFINLLLGALVGFPFLTLLDGCTRAPSHKETVKECLPPPKALWTCSMCPQIRQDHPGECPMCGMNLVSLRSVTSSRGVEVEKSHETMIRLDSSQKSAGNISTSPVEERVILRRVELFGEISCVADKQIDFTWYYGGRIQKTLVDYNTTEIKEGAPLMEVYSEGAVEDQRDCLKMLMELRWHTQDEQKAFDAQYGTNAERVSLVGMSYEHKNMNVRLNAMKDRLIRIGMTAEDFQALELRGKIRDTFTIVAPEKGSLLGPLPHVGERFTMATVLFRFVPLNEVWFVADVYEQDLSLLKLGQEITIGCRTYPDQLFKGKLVYIGKEVDPTKRTVKARFLIANPNGNLIPQLSATGSLEVGDRKPQLALPASAIIDTGRRQLVYVEISPGTFALRTVKIGALGGVDEGGKGSPSRWVPVLEGLAAGEKVVTSGAFLVDAEAQLQGLPASGTDPSIEQP